MLSKQRNVAWNGLTALTDLDTDAFFASSSEAAPLAVRLMHEVADIARALGFEIDPLAPGVLPPEEAQRRAAAMGLDGRIGDTFLKRIKKRGPTTSSMRADVQAGRPLEVDVRIHDL